MADPLTLSYDLSLNCVLLSILLKCVTLLCLQAGLYFVWLILEFSLCGVALSLKESAAFHFLNLWLATLHKNSYIVSEMKDYWHPKVKLSPMTCSKELYPSDTTPIGQKWHFFINWKHNMTSHWGQLTEHKHKIIYCIIFFCFLSVSFSPIGGNAFLAPLKWTVSEWKSSCLVMYHQRAT